MDGRKKSSRSEFGTETGLIITRESSVNDLGVMTDELISGEHNKRAAISAKNRIGFESFQSERS